MSEFKLTDRGFKHYDPISTSYGHEVRIYESSAAMAPHIWLSVELTEEMARAARSNIEPCRAAAHMTIEQATRVRDAIDAAIFNHYQNGADE